MTERDVIAAAATPVTGAALRADFTRLGITPGGVISVHSSLSRLGWVLGGAQTVVETLLDAVGPTGTIMMQTHTSVNSEPSLWENPPVPQDWWPIIREHMPAFDPALSPPMAMGAIVECFLHVAGALRSSHPSESCAAVGPLADALTRDHRLNCAMGTGSPLARLVEHDAQVVLLGVDHGNNTLLHYAEHLANWPGKSNRTFGAAMLVNGRREWVLRDDLDIDSDDFAELGEAFAATGGERRLGTMRLCRARDLMDFAVPWLTRHRAQRG